MLWRELEFLSGTAGLVSLLAQFEGRFSAAALGNRPRVGGGPQASALSPGNARNARKGRRSGPRPHAARTCQRL